MTLREISPEAAPYLERLVPWTREQLAALPGATCAKDRPERLVFRVPLDGPGGPRVFYFKRYITTGARRLVPGKSKAQAEFLITQAAHARGLPVPEPVAFAESGAQSFIVLSEVGAEGHLIEYLRERMGAMTSRDRRACSRRLARFVARLHAEGFFHDDLTALHIRLDARGEFWLIDLDNARLLSRVPDWMCLHNLLQLYRSLTRLHPRAVDAWRFFQYYGQSAHQGQGREKERFRRMERAMDYRTRSVRGWLFRPVYGMMIRGWMG